MLTMAVRCWSDYRLTLDRISTMLANRIFNIFPGQAGRCNTRGDVCRTVNSNRLSSPIDRTKHAWLPDCTSDNLCDLHSCPCSVSMCPGARRTAQPCMSWLWTSQRGWRSTGTCPVTTTPASSRRPFSWRACTTTPLSSTRCCGRRACSREAPWSSWWWSSRSTSPGCVKKLARSRGEMHSSAIEAKLDVWHERENFKQNDLDVTSQISSLFGTFGASDEVNSMFQVEAVRHTTGFKRGKTMGGFWP